MEVPLSICSEFPELPLRDQFIQLEEDFEVWPDFMVRHLHISVLDIGGDIERVDDGGGEGGDGQKLLIIFKY